MECSILEHFIHACRIVHTDKLRHFLSVTINILQSRAAYKDIIVYMIHSCRHFDTFDKSTAVECIVVDILRTLRQHHVDDFLAVGIIDMLRCVGRVRLGIIEVCLRKAVHVGDIYLI